MVYFNNNHNNNQDNQNKPCKPKRDVVEMDATVLEVLPNGICKVILNESKEIVTAYLKGIFKEKKIKVYPQDTVRVEFSIYDLKKGRIVSKYRTSTLPPNFKQTNSARKRKVCNQKHKIKY